jgi:hypothetical protein
VNSECGFDRSSREEHDLLPMSMCVPAQRPSAAARPSCTREPAHCCLGVVLRAVGEVCLGQQP